ncbi:MAG: sugar phosphate isomerase/epimerase [Acidobacteriia bacterium]|nr:sugar phosphate isomerase/epimerase [Terriglobia bacterium]
MAKIRRRRFLQSAAALCGSALLGSEFAGVTKPSSSPLRRFKLGAISDGFAQDFEEALKIMKGYGLRWVEIRNVWGIYNTEASSAQIARLKELLVKYEFKVSVVDTALFKCALPGTRPAEDTKDVYPYAEQMDLLKRASDRAHAFGTDKLRGFTFWRVAQPEKLYPRIAEELERAAEVARRAGVRLILEDEGSCNVGTGRELALLLKNVTASNVGANWDVGNGCWHGEAPFPTGYEALPKQRLGHLHVKGVQCASGFKDCQETFAEQGQIDLLGQFRALVRDGYQETISLECEFEAPGLSHQETARRSLEGLLKVMASALT